jgi:DNA-directed RNA polymerase subunit RPC12/RpoP
MAKQTKEALFDAGSDKSAQGPVECLGMKFPNDEARRAHFTEKLREKLKDPAFRKIEGFPIGEDEDILALSDPPYYTACPNPFLAGMLHEQNASSSTTPPYSRKPFAVDVSEGKTDSLYKAHGYHTKVPHLAIVPSLLHYTEPGDVVLDGFCGSGMTGVAAHFCASPPAEYRSELEQRWAKEGMGKPKWGSRTVILNDLSPAATLITANYTMPFNVEAFGVQAKALLEDVKSEIGWMYQTLHTDGRTKAQIEYTVWSEVYSCAECSGEVVFSEEALDRKTNKVRDNFPCPHCKVVLTKSRLEQLFEKRFDKLLQQTVETPKRKPVLIVYKIGKTRFEKEPTTADLEVLRKIEKLDAPLFPIKPFPFDDMWEATRLQGRQISHVHHLFLPRQAHGLCALWSRAIACPDTRLRSFMIYFVEQAIWGMSVLARYAPTHFSQVNQYLAGVYYVGSQHAECSPWYILEGKRDRLISAFKRQYARQGTAFTSTGDTAALPIPASSVDYIFTDPPFGDNLPYSELNFVVECFLKVTTDPLQEAVVDRSKKNEESQKGLGDYQRLMECCFAEYYRVLKPGRWLTVVFSNSKNAVWTAIQEAMARAGFIVADVRTLDKQQQSFKQVTSIAVKQDLVISAYKPTETLESQFKLQAGTESGVWEFVRTHLGQLPVFVSKGARAEVVAERMSYFLFDRMVAFHVQRGYSLPMSAAEFHAGLAQRFPERESMYFLPEQASEYDRRRLEVKEMEQFELFVSDEKSAIQWVRLQLSLHPMGFSDLQPLYMKEAQRVWEQHEQPLELRTILEQNFVEDGDGKWRVPDPKKESDLEQIRHRALMKEFQQYLDTRGKLKVVRTEALRAGFKESWQKKDYSTIVQMAKRVPEAVIQEDQALLMYFDNASLLSGE